MVSRSRIVLGQLLRLIAVLPPLLVGTLSFAVLPGLMTVVLLFVATIVLAIFAPEIRLTSSSVRLVSVVLLAVSISIGIEWRRIRTRADRETAAMLVETRPPNDSGTEDTAVRTLERLCQQVGVPTPAVRIRETEQPMALTVRYRPSKPPAAVVDDAPATGDDDLSSSYVVVVSTGLLEALTDRELTAVLAHEVAHRSNWDLRVTNALLAPLYSARVGDLNWNRSPLTSFLTAIPIVVARAALSVAAVVFIRGREFAADYGGARLTGDPAALASALETLGDLDTRPSEDLRAAQFLNVLPDRRGGMIQRHSHPSAVVRVKRLRAMVEG